MNKRILNRLVSKLNPDVVQVSPKFRAILGCMLHQKWTEPELISMAMTSDGFLLGQHRGDIGMNDILGSRQDLERNLTGLAVVVELTKTETEALLGLVPATV